MPVNKLAGNSGNQLSDYVITRITIKFTFQTWTFLRMKGSTLWGQQVLVVTTPSKLEYMKT